MTVWRLRMQAGDVDHSVVIEGEPGASAEGLTQALGEIGFSGSTLFVDGERWPSSGEIGDTNLQNGARLTSQPRGSDVIEQGHYLVVVGGPRSGDTAFLEPGVSLPVGRHVPDGFCVEDPVLSRHHFDVLLSSDGSVIATDANSTNGLTYDGSPVESAELVPGDVVQAGSSLFAVEYIGSEDFATVLGRSATGLNIQRQFRAAQAPLVDSLQEPKPPAEQSSGGTPWWRTLMPLVTGIGFAILFDRWLFLLIGAISPIVYTVDNQRRKRKAKREHSEGRETYEVELAEYAARRSELGRCEVRRSRLSNIGGGRSALLARARHRRIWERTPADPDFGSVTLGFAKQQSLVLRPSERGDAAPLLWASPLAISLTADGPVGVVGPLDRARSVVRSLLMELVAFHSPTDLTVWVFAENGSENDWDFVRWLPHAFTPDGGARVAVERDGRRHLMRQLRSLIDSRREAGLEETAIPLTVVVVDGVGLLDPAELNELLREGATVGVVGIIIDSAVVPEGVRTRLDLGDYDDESRFSSATIPPVDQLVVSQVDRDRATEAALRLAPLEAHSRDSSSRPVGTVFFTEMIRFGNRTPEEQAKFWRENSPRTAVPVGVTMDGEIIEMDFVKQGPHGLVGGMTRSGKTEFLKTLFASLALYNHPDDLAIAIIDFKGGVDHSTTANLPHVIELATNQDIDRFERTVELLAAEQQRRQTLFDAEGVKVSNLEAYRNARESNPSLAVIPRLLVVVDEFVELLQTAEGKAQIGRLESLTRIGAGLGVHLLLVTQNFEAQLPPQIAGQAGFRICFKVESGKDSKTVIGSTIAETVSASTKGRWFGRFMGGEVIEFQSARIGNRVRSEDADQGELSARFAPLSTIAVPVGTREEPEVPAAEQDLFRVVELMKAAAVVDGFDDSAMPWPLALPTQLDLATVAIGDDGRAVIGLADNPAQQRRDAVVFDSADAVIAIAGGTASGHHETLITIGLAAALAAPPDAIHLYGIDLLGQGLSRLLALPHTGAVSVRDDAEALRILDWLITEASARRSRFADVGVTDYDDYTKLGGDDLPRIVLLVAGGERLFLHAEGNASPLLAPMTSALNEVVGTGIQVVVSGSMAFLGNRIGMAASRRLIFEANDAAKYPSSLPRSARSQLDIRLRCFDTRSGLLSQIGEVTAEGASSGDVIRAAGAQMVASLGPIGRPPRQFASAPWPLTLGQVGGSQLRPASDIDMALPLGVDPGTGEVYWHDPDEDGTALRIIGGPKSGRSNALGAIALLAGACGWDVVVCLASKRSPLHDLGALKGRLVEPGALLTQRRISDPAKPTLLVIDDAHRLEDFEWEQLKGGNGLVTVVAGSVDVLTKSTGMMRALKAPNGIVLKPTKSRDGTGIGVSSVDEGWLVNPRAGVGFIGIAAEAHRLQFPLVVGVS